MRWPTFLKYFIFYAAGILAADSLGYPCWVAATILLTSMVIFVVLYFFSASWDYYQLSKSMSINIALVALGSMLYLLQYIGDSPPTLSSTSSQKLLVEITNYPYKTAQDQVMAECNLLAIAGDSSARGTKQSKIAL